MNYLQSRAQRFKHEDTVYGRWYSSLTYRQKEAFEVKMKSLMTPEEYAANPPDVTIRSPEKVKLDNEMLQKVCLGEIPITQYIRYCKPNTKKQLTAIYHEINARHRRITGAV